MPDAYGAYLESQVLSASPLQLISLAYNGAANAVAEARRHLAAGRIFERSRAVSKAQELLMELNRSLDFAEGGDLSTRLSHLYGYMLRRLADGNSRQIDEPLKEVETLLGTLAESWAQLAQGEASAPPAAASVLPGASAWAASFAPSERSESGRLSYSL